MHEAKVLRSESLDQPKATINSMATLPRNISHVAHIFCYTPREIADAKVASTFIV